MTYIVSNLALPAYNNTTTITNTLPTGTVAFLSDGGKAMWVQALSGVAQFCAVAIAVDHTAVSLSTGAVTEGTGVSRQIGFAQTSAASGTYCWVALSGRPKVKLASACADRVTLYTTATAGVLDDATVSNSFVLGVMSKTTISNATAITCIVSDGAQAAPYTNPA
jgi:hypothetical protein